MRLIRTAADCLWQRSYAATGVDELCRLADAKKGSFYHFFESKRELAIATIDVQWAATREQVFETLTLSPQPGLNKLLGLAELTAARQRQVFAERQVLLGCPFGHLGQELAHQDPKIRASVQSVFDGHCEYIRAWLDEAVRAREITPGDNASRAQQVFALFEGALLLAKVSANAQVFVDVCAALPAVAGRVSSARPSSGIAPELL